MRLTTAVVRAATCRTNTHAPGVDAGPNASIWELDDAPHVRALDTRPDEYEQRVIGFLDAALAATRR